MRSGTLTGDCVTIGPHSPHPAPALNPEAARRNLPAWRRGDDRTQQRAAAFPVHGVEAASRAPNTLNRWLIPRDLDITTNTRSPCMPAGRQDEQDRLWDAVPAEQNDALAGNGAPDMNEPHRHSARAESTVTGNSRMLESGQGHPRGRSPFVDFGLPRH